MGETHEKWITGPNGPNLQLKYYLQLQKNKDNGGSDLGFWREGKQLAWRWKSKCLVNKYLLGQEDLMSPRMNWWIMDGASWHCTGDRNQDHPQEKEMQKSNMAVWGGHTNSCEKKRSEKQRYKHMNAELQRIARRDKNSLPQRSMQRNRGKQQNGKD